MMYKINRYICKRHLASGLLNRKLGQRLWQEDIQGSIAYAKNGFTL